MKSQYQQALQALRQAFPPPVSDPVHDGYVVFSLLRALDQVDSLKSQAPLLGSPGEPDFDEALRQKVGEESRTVEQVIPDLVQCLQGMPIWGHPRSQMNVVAYPSIASIIGVVLPSMYNPNLCSDESGRRVSEAEVRVGAMAADLVGYPPEQFGGLFTFGGTGALLYGVKIGLEKTLPGCMEQGLLQSNQRVVLLASDVSHYACLNVAGWLGLGQSNVISVPSRSDNAIDTHELEQAARQQIESGSRIAAIIATIGTTDAFGLDDLQAISEIRDRLVAEYELPYRIHIHADAVIGWAWSVFRDYDFRANPLGFRGRTVRSLAAAQHRIGHLELSDSIGIDFHKTGFAPYVSSLVLVKDRHDFAHLVRQRAVMPYLYHSGQYHPGMYTLETTRSGTGPMAALASLRLLGKQGLRVLLGHAVEMAEWLREEIAARPELTILNAENVGPVTLFRAYPQNVNTFEIKQLEFEDPDFGQRLSRHNEFNRRIYQRVHRDALAGEGVALGFTDRYRGSRSGEPVVALKSYVLSPFVDQQQMKLVVERVLEARRVVEQEFNSS